MSKKQKSRTPHGATAMTAAQVQGIQSLRRSGASGGHDSRPARQRTRQAQRRAALRDW